MGKFTTLFRKKDAENFIYQESKCVNRGEKMSQDKLEKTIEIKTIYFNDDDTLDTKRFSIFILRTTIGTFQYIKKSYKNMFYLKLTKGLTLKLWKDRKGNLLFTIIPADLPSFLYDYKVADFKLINISIDDGNLVIDNKTVIQGLGLLMNFLKDLTGNVSLDVLVLLAYLILS